MSWELSPAALDDLDAILRYVERESGSVRVADKLLGDFERAFGDLAANPRIGRVRVELTGPAFRWWHVHRYLVVYDPENTPLRIVRVIHGARFLPAVLDATGD